MRQILQNMNSGKTELVEVPVPKVSPGHVLIRTRCSLISGGTERMLLEFGSANLLGKARQQPDKVREVLDKIRTDGLLPTINAVRNKLDQPLPLGYCNVGTVVQAESLRLKAQSFSQGDRVVSNGPHAEVVCVSENLCAKVPDEVSDDEAVFTAVGAIALEGVRLTQPTLGECFVVIGMGLIGLLTVQILRANGCRVLGIDVDSLKCELAKQFGAETVDISKGEDPIAASTVFSKGYGVDGVLITATTKSSKPVRQAAQMCRKRGRIVLVGVTGLELSRSDFYEKELSFQVSCSYGPGRYDPEYEKEGHDYPIAYVRWTEKRNFEAVLELMAEGKLDVRPLITHRFKFEEAQKAYELIAKRTDPYVGIILDYKHNFRHKAQGTRFEIKSQTTVQLNTPVPQVSRPTPQTPVIGLIGAGNFAGGTLLPALLKMGVRLKTIASHGGVRGTHLGKKFGFEESTTDVERIFDDYEINTVFVTTPHNSHASLVLKGLGARKHVFVEKPLALTREELIQVKAASHQARDRQLMVGFNRRFSPLAVKMKRLVDHRTQPLTLIYTVNAGAIPLDHWAQDPSIGGGRIIGEGCHFIDFLRFLVGSPIVGVEARMIGQAPGVQVQQDKMTILLEFADGSLGAVHYFANGSKRYPKERVEVFSEGRVLVLDNFRKLHGYGWKGFKDKRLWKQDKGHAAEIAAFVARVAEGGDWLIPWNELEEVALATFAAVDRASEPPRAIFEENFIAKEAEDVKHSQEAS